MLHTPLFGIPVGPELLILFLILFVIALPILLLVALVKWLGNGADEKRVDRLERRVDELERELRQR